MNSKFTREELLIRISQLEKELSDYKRSEQIRGRGFMARESLTREDGKIRFEDLFSITDIQVIQDEFAQAADVASIITRPDGTPITRPSNFCRLCKDIIRKTEKGLANCFKSDATIGSYNPDGPIIQPCMSGGLWDAGAAISIGGVHIANWLIGQVRDAHQTEAQMIAYADEIGADREQVLEAFKEVPKMSRKKFGQVSRVLFTIANQLSSIAYQNLKQARLIAQMTEIEEKLRESEARYRDIFNAGSDAIFIVDDTDGTVLDVNAPMLSMYGYSREEVIGSPIGRFSSGLGPYDQKGALSKINKAKKAESLVFEWQAKKKDGELFWVEVSLKFSSILKEQKIISVVRDITQRKKSQELMIQTEKMMSVGGLAAGMAHEINNPLAGIVQNVNLLSNRLTQKDIPANLKSAQKAGTSMDTIVEFMKDRKIPRILKGITESSLRIASIVENMLGFARRGDTSFSTHDPAKIVDRALELASTDYDLKMHYDFRSISIEKAYEDNLPMIPCEGNNIQQVILNLLHNGAQAMSGSQGASDPTFTIRILKEGSAGMLRIEIQDNGPGIDKAIQDKIFEPFFTTKPKGVGTGLGLSVSYFIVTKIHKGTLQVHSEPGKGSTFVIRLPITQAHRRNRTS